MGALVLTLNQAYTQPLRKVQQADFIVAVVNSEPLTNHEVQVEMERVLEQMAQQKRALPDRAQLKARILEQLIDLRIQLQMAKELGIKVDEPSIDQAEQMVASQNGMTVTELHRRLTQEGVDAPQFRSKLHDQILLTRLREREVEPRVVVSDIDIQQYLQEQQSGGQVEQLLNLAQILVTVPENPNPQQLAERQLRAQQVLDRVRAGEDFAKLARAHSESEDRAQGGQLGLKSAARYPELFLEATRSLAPGQSTGLIRSGAGFHILKVIERRSAGLPPQTVTQTHARHILLRPSAQLSERQAIERLQDYRKRIAAGRADFASLAREHSHDGSASAGGDLGWANPGQFVPEFESVMNRLAPGQVSEPLISRFGVHLIQVMQRRERELSEPEQRELVRNMLRGKKFDEVYAKWLADLRARAYIELREQPE